MKSKKFLLFPLIFLTLTLVSCSSNKQNYMLYAPLPMDVAYSKVRSVSNFNDYVSFLKQKAAGEGGSERVLNAQN